MELACPVKVGNSHSTGLARKLQESLDLSVEPYYIICCVTVAKINDS